MDLTMEESEKYIYGKIKMICQYCQKEKLVTIANKIHKNFICDECLEEDEEEKK